MAEPLIRYETLKLERVTRGLSRLDVTLKAWDLCRRKIAPETISRIESGVTPAYGPTRDTLCQVFEMSEEKLFPERFVQGANVCASHHQPYASDPFTVESKPYDHT